MAPAVALLVCAKAFAQAESAPILEELRPTLPEQVFPQPVRAVSTAVTRRAEAEAEPAGDAGDDPPSVDGSSATRVTAEPPADTERNLRVAPVAAEQSQAARPVTEENPFAPLGLRAGSFTFFPSLEIGLGWTSNASAGSGGSPAVLSDMTLRLDAMSDWSRHSLELAAFGRLRRSLSGELLSDPSAGISARLRLDLAEGLAADAGLSYKLRRESASSAVIVPGVASQPLLHEISADIGIARQADKLRLAARGSFERLAFDDAELIGGGMLSQGERNQTIGTVSLRAGYVISPALAPFVEAEIGRRNFADALDAAAYARSAKRYALRAGIEFDRGEKLRGEIAAGWIVEQPEDARLAAIEGLSVAAGIEWSPIRGTIVRFDANTAVETTTEPGLSGSIIHSATFGVERQMRASLTGNLAARLAWRDYIGSNGSETILDLEAGLTWWLNRHAGLTGRVRHERVRSNIPGRDSDATSLFAGVRLQR